MATNINSVERGAAVNRLSIVEEKLEGMEDTYRILSLEATIARAELDMDSNFPLRSTIARAEKAKAEIALARIEIKKLKEEVGPDNFENFGKKR